MLLIILSGAIFCDSDCQILVFGQFSPPILLVITFYAVILGNGRLKLTLKKYNVITERYGNVEVKLIY